MKKPIAPYGIPPGVRLIFRPMMHTENAHGSTAGAAIMLDPRSRVPLARTLLHELLHIQNPQWSENRVQKEERVIWGKMTWRDKGFLYKQLGKATMPEDEDDGPGGLPVSAEPLPEPAS